MSRIAASPVDPRVGLARLLGGRPILRSQMQALRYTLPESPVTILGLFGAWRAGKTTLEMLAALSVGIQNPWNEDYGGNRPCTLMVTETVTVMRDAMYAALMEVWPEGLIAQEVRHPAWDIELPNGHVYALRTDRGALEGKTVVTTLIDEIHKVRTKRDYLNYTARASDAKAAKNMTIVAGLPIDNGWLREEFDRQDNDPRRAAIYMRTADNVHLPKGYADRLRSSCSAREAKTLLDAEWHVYEGAIYDEYDSTRHITDTPPTNEPVHIGLDAGHQAAIVVGQVRQRRLADGRFEAGLHIVDELLPDSTSVEAAIAAVYARGWRLAPGYSYVCTDPRLDLDQVASIRRVLAQYGADGVELVQRKRGEMQEAVEYGIRCVQAALLDAAGNIRLTFAKSLASDAERGLRRAMPKYRWDPKTRRPVKDNKIDHVLDALRYLVAQILPSAGAEIGVLDDPYMRR